MASEGTNARAGNKNTNSKKRRAHYLPYNRPVKKGHYAVRPGVEGFFITCDGGRESQARNEAINLFDKFYEELLQQKGLERDVKSSDQVLPIQPSRIVFKSDDEGSSSSDDESDKKSGNENGHDGGGGGENDVEKKLEGNGGEVENEAEKKLEGKGGEVEKDAEKKLEGKGAEGESPVKEQLLETNPEKNAAENSQARCCTIDKLIEAELEELGDREKVKFAGLESGCNGVIFIRMRKESGCPSPSELVEYIMDKAASTGKHMSRFILRVLPVELTCYASVEEITRAAKSLIEQHFPSGEEHPPFKFAVLYEARANSGIDRIKIIDTVAKLVPQGHKVDLSNPDKTIVVQIVKTICMIGVVHKFKQLLKYNLRQLTSVKKS